MKNHFLAVLVLFFLYGCADPLPEDKLHYVGLWQSKEMRLVILADGTVAYKRLQGGGSTSINGPLKEFVGDDFVVGVLFLTTTFDVSAPPRKESEKWVMTVDGIKLTKAEE